MASFKFPILEFLYNTNKTASLETWPAMSHKQSSSKGRKVGEEK